MECVGVRSNISQMLINYDNWQPPEQLHKCSLFFIYSIFTATKNQLDSMHIQRIDSIAINVGEHFFPQQGIKLVATLSF